MPPQARQAIMQPMHLDRESALTAAEPVPAPAATILEVDGGTDGRRTLTRDSVLFGAGALAGKAIGFLVLPIFARLLAPEQFGRLDVLNTLVSSALLIAMLGMDVAAVRLYFDGRTAEERRRLLATWAMTAAIVAAIPALVLIVGSQQISEGLFGSSDLALAVALAGVAIFGGLLHFVALGVLRATGRPLPYALVEGGALAVNAGLAVALLATWRADATPVMLALAICWCGAAAIGLFLVRGSIASRPSAAAARTLMLLALPLAPAIAATWGADFFHRAFLLGASGATQVAYLSIATRIGSVAMLVVAAAQLAWHPHAYRLGVSSEATTRLSREGRQIVVALALTVGLIGVFTPELLAVVGGSPYAAAAPTVGFVLVSVLGVGLFTVGSLPSAIARRTGDMAWAVVVGVVVAVIGNLLVAARLGAPGTAAAMALGQLTTAAIAIRLGGLRQDVPFEWRRLWGSVAIAGLVVIASTATGETALVVRLALGAGLVAAFVLEGTLAAWLASISGRLGAAGGA